MPVLQKIAVIGSGVMGAGIAAQIANSGTPVLLLDLPSQGEDRSGRARDALARLKASRPAAFMSPGCARLVTPGNTEEDLEALGTCDWIIEVIVEDLEIKRQLFKSLHKHKKPGALVSSNTSTIPLADMSQGFPKAFRESFCITHFFNPPRYMRLLEIVPGEARPELVQKVTEFADRFLGKGIVLCQDTPGFIANRIGIFWLHCAAVEALKQNISVEEADQVLGRPLGIPKTGVFALMDMIGLDLMPHVLKSFSRTLPESDMFHGLGAMPSLVEDMISKGYTGRKGKGGFYRLGEGRVKEAFDLVTGLYHKAQKPHLPFLKKARGGGVRYVFSSDHKVSQYAWDVMSQTLVYAGRLADETGLSVSDIDRALRLGYNWRFGPFQMLDRLGLSYFCERWGKELPHIFTEAREGFYKTSERHYEIAPGGAYRPLTRPKGVLLLEDVKCSSDPLFHTPSASVWDVGEGALCLEFHSRMNTMDPLTLLSLHRALSLVKKRNAKGLVIYNEGEHFSAGANIGILLYALKVKFFPAVSLLVSQGQKALRALKYAPFPVVGAPSGLALGGGCEVLLHCDAIQAHAESYVGLVETGAGLCPAWGGCKELLWRALAGTPKGPMAAVSRAFETIAMAKVSTSAEEAKTLGFLRQSDGVTMNRERLLFDARETVLRLSEGYVPPESPVFSLPGPSAYEALMMAVHALRKQKKATAYDVFVAEKVALVLSGGQTDVTEPLLEDALYQLEQEAFMSLVPRSETFARIEHLLKTGKPLRN